MLLVLAVGYVLLTFHWAYLGNTLRNMNALLFFGGGSATIVVYWLLRTARWSLLITAANAHVPFRELYFSTAISLGLAIVTPLQSGEAGKIEWLKHRGKLDRGTGYSAYFLERLLDFMVICAFALAGLSGRTSIGVVVASLLAGLALAIVGLLWFVRRRSRFSGFVEYFRLFTADTKTFLGVLGLTIASWLVVTVGWYACLASLSILLSASDSIALVGLVTIVNVLSLVPGAWGVSEIGIAEFLRTLGYGAVDAQAGAVILRAYGLLTLVVAAFHLLLARGASLNDARHTSQGRDG